MYGGARGRVCARRARGDGATTGRTGGRGGDLGGDVRYVLPPGVKVGMVGRADWQAAWSLAARSVGSFCAGSEGGSTRRHGDTEEEGGGGISELRLLASSSSSSSGLGVSG